MGSNLSPPGFCGAFDRTERADAGLSKAQPALGFVFGNILAPPFGRT